MSTTSQKARYYFHLGIYVTTLATCSVLGVVYSLLLTVVGQRLNINYLTARSFYYLCSPLIGIKFEVEGEQYLKDVLLVNDRSVARSDHRDNNGVDGSPERDGEGEALLEHKKLPRSAVLVGNHQSLLDILYLGRIFPHRAAIMAKKELKWMPLLGWFMSLSGAVFVNRSNRHDAVKAMNAVGEEMKRRDISLWIFPEGTRSMSAEPHLLPFKKGAFHLAVQAQVPILPVVCENYHRLFDGKTRLESGVLKIRVLPPVSTEGLTSADVHDLAERVRQQMLTTLAEISTNPSGSSASSLSFSSTHPSNMDVTVSKDTAVSVHGGLGEQNREGRDIYLKATSSTASLASSMTSPESAAQELGALDEEFDLGLAEAIRGEGVEPKRHATKTSA